MYSLVGVHSVIITVTQTQSLGPQQQTQEGKNPGKNLKTKTPLSAPADHPPLHIPDAYILLQVRF